MALGLLVCSGCQKGRGITDETLPLFAFCMEWFFSPKHFALHASDRTALLHLSRWGLSRMKKTAMFLMMFLGVSAAGWAEVYTGKVLDAITLEPLPNAQIFGAQGVKVLADATGKFQIDVVDSNVQVVMPGYDVLKLQLKSGENVATLTVKGLFEVAQVQVKAKADSKKAVVSKQEVGKKEIKQTTATLFPDVVRVVQMLPGVTSGVDYSGQLYVRGGEPREVRSILDNQFLMRDDIWGGMLSVFNPNLVEDVQFYSGGFSAEWPQAMSGILDIKNKTGDTEKYLGFAEASATTLDLFAEGPGGLKDSSFLAGVRRTHYDLIVGLIQRTNMILPYFWDGQAKYDLPLESGGKLTVNAIFSSEGLRQTDTTNYEGYGPKRAKGSKFEYDNERVNLGIAYDRAFTPEISSLTLLGAFYNKGKAVVDSFYAPMTMEENDLIMQLRHNWQLILAERHIVKTGLYFFPSWSKSNWKMQTLTAINANQYVTQDYNYNLAYNNIYFTGVFVQDDYELLKDCVYMNPGVIAQYYSENKKWAYDPRFSLKYKFLQNWDVHTATGFYSQHPLDTYMLDAKNGNPNLKAQTAIHYVLGTKAEFEGGYTFQVEGYYKDCRNMIISDANPAINYSNNARGRAYGFDFIIQKKIGEKWDGWISYSWVRSQRRIDQRSNPSVFGKPPDVEPVDEWYTSAGERPHTFNLVFNYTFKPRWRLSFVQKYVSGKPFTPVAYGEYQEAIDEYTPVYGTVNSDRVGPYMTTDIKLSMPVGGVKGLSSFVQVSNLFNNENPYGVEYKTDYSGYRNIPQLPRMTFGGFRYDF